jgi:hypothetical protein
VQSDGKTGQPHTMVVATGCATVGRTQSQSDGEAPMTSPPRKT